MKTLKLTLVALLVWVSRPPDRAHAHGPVGGGPALGVGGLAGAAGDVAGVAALVLHARAVVRTVKVVLAFTLGN